jgi:hypothetical protein
MPHEKEVANALRVLGLTGSEIATPDLIDRARRFIYEQRRIQEAHREQERYFERVGSFGGHVASTMEQSAPPPRPVREILAEALAEVHIPAYPNLLYRPGDVLLDFAYPLTRFAVVFDPLSEEDMESLRAGDWRVKHVKEESVRRFPLSAARFIKGAYLEHKKARARR